MLETGDSYTKLVLTRGKDRGSYSNIELRPVSRYSETRSLTKFLPRNELNTVSFLVFEDVVVRNFSYICFISTLYLSVFVLGYCYKLGMWIKTDFGSGLKRQCTRLFKGGNKVVQKPPKEFQSYLVLD